MEKSLRPIDRLQSDALRIATFLMTVFVVLRHSFNLHLYYEGGNPWMETVDANVFLQQLMTFITNVAIPAFFLMSGFLFFWGMKRWQECLPKWQRRIRTLVVPYLLWNLSWLLLIGAFFCFFPALRQQLHTSFGFEWSFSYFFASITTSPVVGQFWYIRTLILFLLCAPALFFVLKSAPLSAVAVVALVRLWQPIDTGIFSTEGILFFFIGSWIGVNGHLPEIQSFKTWFWLLILLAFYHVLPFFGVTVLDIPIGVMTMLVIGWQICLFLARCEKTNSVFLALSRHSFFMYAVHGTLVSASSVIVSRMISHDPLHSLAAYLGCFFGTVAISLGGSWLGRKIVPRMYSLFTGGR